MSKGVDLDAMLDEVIESSGFANSKPAAAEPTTIDPKIRVVSDDIKPWLAFTANVQKDYREKWTKMAKVDIETEISSRFQPSYAYRSWDGPVPVKNGINRSLQDIVKKSALIAKLDESKISRLLTLVNPVTDSENGKQLQVAFAKQLIQDFEKDIRNDPNYDATRFTALAAALPKEQSS
jgi:hypothetical protein